MGNPKRHQPMRATQITDPESIEPGMPFLVESFTPGKSGVNTVMVGVFTTGPFSNDQGRVVKARFRKEGAQDIEVATFWLGFDLGFYGRAYRRVYRLPRSPF